MFLFFGFLVRKMSIFEAEEVFCMSIIKLNLINFSYTLVVIEKIYFLYFCGVLLKDKNGCNKIKKRL